MVPFFLIHILLGTDIGRCIAISGRLGAEWGSASDKINNLLVLAFRRLSSRTERGILLSSSPSSYKVFRGRYKKILLSPPSRRKTESPPPQIADFNPRQTPAVTATPAKGKSFA